MGEHKRRKNSADRPMIEVYPVILDRAAANGFRPDEGCIAVIVDELEWPLVAIQVRVSSLPHLLAAGDRALRTYQTANDCFWGGFRSWCNCERDPVPGMTTDAAHASALSAVFWMAMRDPENTPGRSQIVKQGVDLQIKEYGAAAITLAVLDVPFGRTGDKTQRWIINHGSEPTYVRGHAL